MTTLLTIAVPAYDEEATLEAAVETRWQPAVRSASPSRCW